VFSDDDRAAIGKKRWPIIAYLQKFAKRIITTSPKHKRTRRAGPAAVCLNSGEVKHMASSIPTATQQAKSGAELLDDLAGDIDAALAGQSQQSNQGATAGADFEQPTADELFGWAQPDPEPELSSDSIAWDWANQECARLGVAAVLGEPQPGAAQRRPKPGAAAKALASQGYGKQTPIEEGEASTNEGPAAVVPHCHVLDSILEKVVKLDFSRLFKGIDSVKQKHYLVSSIEQLLKLVRTHNYRLARKNDFVFAFNGQYWAEIDRDTLKDFLMAVAQKQGIPPLEAKHYEFRDKLYKQFLALAGFKTPEPTDEMVLINLLNGTFEISAEKQAIRHFSAADFLTHQLQFKYDPDAAATKFQAYLDRVLPEKELQDIVAEYFGYVFMRCLKLEKALLLYGSGANGKSVLFDVMNALIGRENIGNYSLADLMEEHNRAQIANKLLNYGSEINASVTRDVFKNLVSGEPIMARLKYGNSFLMERYAKLCFNCNELPKDIEQTDAYFRRLLIVPFRVTIPESEWIVDLAQQIIKEELAGVFNWVLDGLKRLLKQKKFTKSEIVKKMIAEYRQESDSVACFLRDENWGPDPHKPAHVETLKKVHLSYQSYCREAGFKPLGRNHFKQRLVANGIAEATKAGCAQEFYINRLGANA
jgi:putative DNA primase/helicase